MNVGCDRAVAERRSGDHDVCTIEASYLFHVRTRVVATLGTGTRHKTKGAASPALDVTTRALSTLYLTDATASVY
jgi:hypothetical protein